MNCTNNPIICVTYHDPLDSTIQIIEQIDSLAPIEPKRASIQNHHMDNISAQLFKADILVPEQTTKRSRYRFRWKVPKTFRQRSQSAGISDLQKFTESVDNLKFSSGPNTPNECSPKLKKKSQKLEIEDRFMNTKSNTLVSTNVKVEDKKTPVSLANDPLQPKRGNFFRNIRDMAKTKTRPDSIPPSIPVYSKSTDKPTSPTQQYNLCSECPPPKPNKFSTEVGNPPQLFPIPQRKELSGKQCNHNNDPIATVSGCDNSKVKRQTKTLVTNVKKDASKMNTENSSRMRSNSGSIVDHVSYKMPDPMKLPEHEPTSSLTFCKIPLKSSDDDRYWVADNKRIEGGYFKKLSKTSISKSEQNLVISETSKRLESALSQSRPSLDIGNETVEAAILHGVNRITEHQQYVLLSKTSTRDFTTYLSEGIHVMGEAESFYAFFQHSTCYDLMPDNSKLVVLDSRLQVGKAFRALIFNGVRAALVWKSDSQKYVGILTITDFIRILNLYIQKTPGLSMIDIETQTIDKWREITGTLSKPLVYVCPESSLFIALKELKHHKVHRLPVIDLRSGNVLHIITHKRLLKYLYIKKHKIPNAHFLKLTVEESNAGTFENVHTATLDTPIREVLNIFETQGISAVPVVDQKTHRLLDIYAKFDCIHLASTGNYKDLNLTIEQALTFRVKSSFRVQTILKTDTLGFAMEKIVLSEVHRLVVINNEDERVVQGILSLADFLHYFVLRHNGRHSLGTIGSSNNASCCVNVSSSSTTELARRTSSPDSLNNPPSEPDIHPSRHSSIS